jgi:hypothetical protein
LQEKPQHLGRVWQGSEFPQEQQKRADERQMRVKQWWREGRAACDDREFQAARRRQDETQKHQPGVSRQQGGWISLSAQACVQLQPTLVSSWESSRRLGTQNEKATTAAFWL